MDNMRPQLVKKKRVSSLNIILAIIVLVILALVGIIGYLAYQYSTNPELKQKINQNQGDLNNPEELTEDFIYEDDSKPYDDSQGIVDPESLLPNQAVEPVLEESSANTDIEIVDPESLLPN